MSPDSGFWILDSDFSVCGHAALCYELLKEAGRQVEWVSHKHPRHGFIYPGRGKDGAYHPDEIQLAAIEGMLKFFGKYMK